ncbi:MAG: nucleotidyl transferase AbiEii/AbiGii toxin family protein [Parcubacteria group bacterium]
MTNLLEKHLNKVEPEQKKNFMREYFQTLILKLIYGSKFNQTVSFMGGTCLRICYDLARFSEDLDFNLTSKKFKFSEMLDYLETELTQLGFKVDIKGKDEKVVYKGFIRISDVLDKYKIFPHKNEKLSIKLEIDSQPPQNYNNETNIIAKYGYNFVIKNADLPSLMAGKINACFNRGYYKGRDFYDLVWYLNHKITPNFKLLREFNFAINDQATLVDYLQGEIKKIDIAVIVKDVYPFLENEEEIEIIENLSDLFPQVARKYLLQTSPGK